MSIFDMQEYFQYLKKRSLVGFVHRELLVYPKLSRKLNGKLLDVGSGINDFVRFRANPIDADISRHNVDIACSRDWM